MRFILTEFLRKYDRISLMVDVNTAKSSSDVMSWGPSKWNSYDFRWFSYVENYHSTLVNFDQSLISVSC